MADVSSSSSSSLDSSSSSSSSSTSLMYSSSSSSSSVQYSSSSSSSSSIDSSSSSSSSYLDYSGDKELPFDIEQEDFNPTWSVVSSGEYLFAGTGSEGKILRSKDGYHWEIYYKTDDYHVKALYVDSENGILFAGTSPKGSIYKFHLTDNILDEVYALDGEVIKFLYTDRLLCILNGKSSIYEYINGSWDKVYDFGVGGINLLEIEDKYYIETKYGWFDPYLWIYSNKKPTPEYNTKSVYDGLNLGYNDDEIVFVLKKELFDTVGVYFGKESVLPSISSSSSSSSSSSIDESSSSNNNSLDARVFDNPFRSNPKDEFGICQKVLSLHNDEKITDVLKKENLIFVTTTNGRIILGDLPQMIGLYLTGQRNIFANIKNGVGIEAETTANINYALYKRIVKITEDNVIEKWKYEVNACAIETERINGVFLGPILYVEEDLGFWKELVWEETKPSDTSIIVSLRAANTSAELLNSPWKYTFCSNTGEISPIVREINSLDLNGQYLQVKVEMITNKKSITPSVSKITVKYSTKQASYFFTTQFSMERDSGVNNGIIVAKITEPKNTEVRFGLATKNSGEWKDYHLVDPNKMVELENLDSLKVGIKFISYDASVPEVAEFAIMNGSRVVKALNG